MENKVFHTVATLVLICGLIKNSQIDEIENCNLIFMRERKKLV